MENKTISYSSGISIGNILAIVLSWTKWHSIWWTILHGCLGWFYVIYYGINYL